MTDDGVPDAGDLPPGDELRVARLFTLGIGIVAGVAAIAMAAEVARPAADGPPAALLGFQFVLFIGAGLAGTVAGLLGRTVLRVVNGILVVLHLLVLLLALALLVTGATPLQGRQLSWMLIVVAIPVLSALVAWGPVGGWCTFGAFLVLVAGLRLAVSQPTPNSLTNDVHTFSTAMVLCTLGAVVLGAARQADAAAAQARLAGIRAAVASARNDVRMRAQLIVHDEVLAALGFAGRATANMIAPLAAQARRAGELVRDLSAVRARDADVAPRALVRELSALAAEHGAVCTESGSPAFAPVPGPVADALIGAAQQALVNRDRHAPGSHATMEVSWSAEALEVVVRDDGPGFDVAEASRRRMGVAVSILTRMRALPGGDAVVDSRVGAGTAVRLEWRPVPVDDSPSAAGREALDPPLGDAALRALGVALVAGQVFLGAYDVARTGDVLRPVFVTLLVLASFAVVIWWPASRARTQTLVLAVLTAAAVSTIGLTGGDDGPSYADYWPLTAEALALGLLCLRGRPRVAVPLAAAGFLAMCLFLLPGPFGQLAAGTVRALSIVLVSAVLAGGLLRLRARAQQSRRRVLEMTTAKAWQVAERDASKESARRLLELVGGMLERIGEGRELTPDEAAGCRALEGRLRDEYRGGRLAREPVITAVADARRRGVDVVLIDDLPERPVDEARLQRILLWIAEGVRESETTFLGRLLPDAGSARARVAVDGRATDFGG